MKPQIDFKEGENIWATLYIYSKKLFYILHHIKVYFMSFNNPFRIYDASIFNIMLFCRAERAISLIYFSIFLKATFILEPTFINLKGNSHAYVYSRAYVY